MEMLEQPMVDQVSDIALSERVTRRPLHFGADDASLFGWLHTPREPSVLKHGVVICPPLGVDYVNTYPVLRWLSDRLAAEGVAVLRFDYSGMGNSHGFVTDPDRLSQWLGDIRTARRTLAELTGCAEVGVLSVRTGALLAAAVANDTAMPFLVVWGAVARGRAYMREMRALQAMQFSTEGVPQDAMPEGDEVEAGGFLFTEQTARDIAAMNLADFKPKAQRVLIADRDDLPGNAALAQNWTSEDAMVEYKVLPGFAGMLIAPQESIYSVPRTAVDELVHWIATVPPTRSGVKSSYSSAAQHGASFRGVPQAKEATVHESAMRFGPGGNRFGIATVPCRGFNPKTPWFILLNSGALHTVGPNRLYVLLVRALAHAGIPCFRFDFPNVGDSVIDPLVNENRLYETTNSAEVASAIAALTQEHGAKSFVLMGLCSGSYASFHAGLDLPHLPIVESILFNPLRFYWDENSVLGEIYRIPAGKKAEIEQLRTWQYYMGAIRDMQRWKSLLAGRADVGTVFSALMKRMRQWMKEAIERWAPIETLAGKDADPLARDVHRFIESGRLLTFVFARSEPGHAFLMSHAGPVVTRYMRNKKIRIWFIERTDHTFTKQEPRGQFIQSIIDHAIRHYR